MKYLKLKKNSDFKKLFSKGKRAFSPYLSLLYFPSQKTRMGIAVSKKHGKAVVRNRLKRLLRAAFAECADTLEGDYLIILNPNAREDGNYDFHELKDGITACIKKVNNAKKAEKEDKEAKKKGV